MLVDCPDCGRSYRLDAADLGAGGRVVICPRCDARWFQRAAGERRIDAAAWTTVRTAEGPAPRSARAKSATGSAPALDAAALAAGRPAPSADLVGRMRLGIVAAVMSCIGVAGVAARAEVVRVAPRTASLYAAIGWPVNLRGLRFSGIVPVRSQSSPADVTIGGEIRNVTGRRQALPRLVFEIRDGEGAMLARWSEAPPASTLPPGRRLGFASRPQRMPADGRTVLVRFEDPMPDEGTSPVRQRVVSR